MEKVWIDQERCAGCGACVDVCPTEAITLIDGKARVNDALCQGCQVCLEACATGAVQPIIEIDPAPVMPRYPATQAPAVPISQTSTTLRENAITTLAIAGTGLALRAAQAVGRWLLRLPTSSLRTPQRSNADPIDTIARGIRSQGRQHRHRRRGL